MQSHNQFERGPIYQNLQYKLLELRKRGEKVNLNIHIPGTGGKKFDAFPTCTALQSLSEQAAVIYFEGVGGQDEAQDVNEAERYIHPVRSSPYSLEAGRQKPVSPLRGLSAFSTSNAEDFAANTPKLAGLLGIVTGAGSVTNNQRIVNTLKALDMDGILPEHVFLSGHSRGAVNCVSLANEIYREFGDRILLNLCITDPVPGPGNHRDPLKKIIPPSVVSFTCFYAQTGSEKLDSSFYATGAHDFILTNPNTTMTCFMVPHTNHGSILGDSHVVASIFNITHAVNDSKALHEIERKNLNVEVMLGAGARAKVNYHRVSAVSAHLPPLLSAAVQMIRQVFDMSNVCQLVLSEAPRTAFNANVMASRKEREKLLSSGYKRYAKNPALLFEAVEQPKPEAKASYKSISSFSSFK